MMTLGIIMQASSAFAQRRGSKSSGSTLSITTGGGLSTHKSKTVESNDTATSIVYGVKFRAGRSGDIGIEYSKFSTPTTFELNTSEITTSFADTSFSYHMWLFYLGLSISNTDIIVDNSGTEIFDGLGSGYGGVFGMDIPVGKGNSFIVEMRSITTSTLKHDSASEITLGPRTDVNFSGKIALTKQFLALDIGFKQSTYSVSIGGTSTAETVYTTWAGLSFNLNP